MTSARLAPLDGIRAIAIAMVIVFHATSIARFPLDWLGPLATPVVHGWMGVDLFFGMSGFLITRLWLDEEEEQENTPNETPGSRARRFFARRALRILPLYYFTLVGFLVLARVAPLPSLAPFAARVAKSPSVLAPYALFFVNYVRFGHDGAFAARWSLAVEEHFYLLWPCVLLALRARRHRLAVAATLCVAILAARTLAIGLGDHRHGWTSFMMVRYASHFRIDSIVWGCVAALGYEALAKAERARRLALLALVLGVVLLVVSDEITVLQVPTLVGGGIGGAVIAGAAALLSAEVTAAPRSWLARALSVPPLPTIGFHSYAMYLVHPLAIDVAVDVVFGGTKLPTVWHWTAACALSIALALVAAIALHFTVERPFRGLRARMRRVRRSHQAVRA